METDKIIQKYRENYCHIFEKIYPSKGSTGFTERNLSVNFAKAYEHYYPNAITWYEFQFGEKNNLHYDAIIIDSESKEIVVIESKRFSYVHKKVKEVGEDIERICKFKTEYFKEFSYRIPDLREYAVKGVILADVWTEGSEKSKLKQSFENRTFLRDYHEKLLLGLHPDSWFVNGEYFCKNFTSVKVSAVRKNNTIPTNYCLVGMIWDVK